MRARFSSQTYGDVTGFRFSIHYLGRNWQSVYMFQFGDVLIDSGQANSRKNVLKVLQGRSIRHLLITHHHEDHTGNAGILQQRFGLTVKAHPECVQKLNKGFIVNPISMILSGNVRQAAAEPVMDEQVLQMEGYEVTCLFTPGHTIDHVAFYIPEKGYLFPGDLYVADRIKYFESNEDIKQQIVSLKKLASLDFDSLFCSHNPKPAGGRERLLRKLQIFEQFYHEVVIQRQKGLSEKEILHALGRRENYFYKYMTAGYFCSLNMVRSVLRAEGLS